LNPNIDVVVSVSVDTDAAAAVVVVVVVVVVVAAKVVVVVVVAAVATVVAAATVVIAVAAVVVAIVNGVTTKTGASIVDGVINDLIMTPPADFAASSAKTLTSINYDFSSENVCKRRRKKTFIFRQKIIIARLIPDEHGPNNMVILILKLSQHSGPS
jgi:predicted phage tail protein